MAGDEFNHSITVDLVPSSGHRGLPRSGLEHQGFDGWLADHLDDLTGVKRQVDLREVGVTVHTYCNVASFCDKSAIRIL